MNSIMADNMLVDTTLNMFNSIVEEDIGQFLVNIPDTNSFMPLSVNLINEWIAEDRQMT